MEYYIVTIVNVNMDNSASTICKSKSQMEHLVKNLDTEKFIIDNISRIYNCLDMVEFLKKNEGIETGKKEGSDVN